MSTFMNQQQRFISWLGDCAQQWVLHSLQGEERLSQPFCWQATFSTLAGNEPALKLGTEVACHLSAGGQKRVIHGVITCIEQQHDAQGGTCFTATLSPALVLARQALRLRVFQNKSIPDLVTEILSEYGISNVKRSLSRVYAAQEYFIQYRESDFDFISRLLEQAGIGYFFVHSEDSHVMVLADHANAYAKAAVAELPWQPVAGLKNNSNILSGETMRHHISPLPANYNAWGESSVACLGQQDANGQSESERQARNEENRRHWLDYSKEKHAWAADCFWMSCGERFTLLQHPSESGDFIITGMSLSAKSNTVGGADFNCILETASASKPVRPACVTTIPVIPSVLTATVVGPDSEEIHTDEYGRIKIQFPWDEVHQLDDSSSCWIRVAQPWAGGNFGALFLPRIGSEVLVSFIQGHPDYPIVTGSVYSAAHKPPFALPLNKTQTGFVSRSSLNGELSDAHSIVFEDKKDKEKLILSSHRDLHLTVKNDAETRIGNEEKITIGKGRTSEIKQGDDRLTLKQGSQHLTLEQGERIQLLKKGGYRLTLESGNHELKVQGDATTELNNGELTTIISGGGSSLKADKECVIESAKGITFRVGSNEIALTATGITIKGTQLTLEGQVATTVKAAKVDVNGTAMVAIDGGLIKIG